MIKHRNRYYNLLLFETIELSSNKREIVLHRRGKDKIFLRWDGKEEQEYRAAKQVLQNIYNSSLEGD